jgi:HD-GYP domain-containing protein (c-di-GMP phosphodiesterase class II)/DNA-binding CsgD family transcriptional regulator
VERGTAETADNGARVPHGYLRTADLLGALSLAADLAVGLPAEHAVRSCYIGMRVAEQLDVPAAQLPDVYYAHLLMDIGCTAWTSQLAGSVLSDDIEARRQLVFAADPNNPLAMLGWLAEYMAPGEPPLARVKRGVRFAVHGREFAREGFRNTCEVARRFAQRLGMSEMVQQALLSVFEQWDGGGPRATRGEAIPLTSRIVYATSFIEAFHSIGGREAAVRVARQRHGKAFDPSVADAFLAVCERSGFWENLEQESLWETVLALEPISPHRYLPEARLEDVALAFADFADLKSSYSVGHSRRVGELAERLARRLALAEPEVTVVRRAALMHDVGLAAVPSLILDKPQATLTQVEWERLRLHPYHAERILSRVPALAPVVPLVAAHHERPDGRGYYRGLSGAQIPLGAQLIAAADTFDELTHDAAARPALEPVAALAQLQREAGSVLSAAAVGALAGELGMSGAGPGNSAANRPGQRPWPAGLSGREVEILRLLARGLSRRELARQLVLSEHTVRHHLEHIYNKLGVSTRVAATLFAVEHDLLA